MPSSNILIVDDDPQIRDILRIALQRAGFSTACVAEGVAALKAVRESKPDLVVLDIGLPEMDGLEVCRTLRKTSNVPVLFLTALDEEVDRILGLELGADDYVTKPFSPRELIARVKAILRRSGGASRNPTEEELKRGVLAVLPATHVCIVKGRSVSLTATEMALLAHMLSRPEIVLSRIQLGDALYGNNIHVSDRTVDSHLRNLRRKLADAGCGDAIETLHGVGVRMGPCLGA